MILNRRRLHAQITNMAAHGVVVFLLVTGAFPAVAHDASLALTYAEFDQRPHSGWRALADEKQFGEAAALIEAYLARHPQLDRFQRSNLHFHAAQLLAFAGKTEPALKHLERARLDPEPESSPIRWNDYVSATAAFLQRDRLRLVAARERIAKGAAVDREIPNLAVVDRLIARFDEPYAEAYGQK